MTGFFQYDRDWRTDCETIVLGRLTEIGKVRYTSMSRRIAEEVYVSINNPDVICYLFDPFRNISEDTDFFFSAIRSVFVAHNVPTDSWKEICWLKNGNFKLVSYEEKRRIALYYLLDLAFHYKAEKGYSGSRFHEIKGFFFSRLTSMFREVELIENNREELGQSSTVEGIMKKVLDSDCSDSVIGAVQSMSVEEQCDIVCTDRILSLVPGPGVLSFSAVFPGTMFKSDTDWLWDVIISYNALNYSFLWKMLRINKSCYNSVVKYVRPVLLSDEEEEIIYKGYSIYDKISCLKHRVFFCQVCDVPSEKFVLVNNGLTKGFDFILEVFFKSDMLQLLTNLKFVSSFLYSTDLLLFFLVYERNKESLRQVLRRTFKCSNRFMDDWIRSARRVFLADISLTPASIYYPDAGDMIRYDYDEFVQVLYHFHSHRLVSMMPYDVFSCVLNYKNYVSHVSHEQADVKQRVVGKSYVVNVYYPDASAWKNTLRSGERVLLKEDLGNTFVVWDDKKKFVYTRTNKKNKSNVFSYTYRVYDFKEMLNDRMFMKLQSLDPNVKYLRLRANVENVNYFDPLYGGVD